MAPKYNSSAPHPVSSAPHPVSSSPHPFSSAPHPVCPSQQHGRLEAAHHSYITTVFCSLAHSARGGPASNGENVSPQLARPAGERPSARPSAGAGRGPGWEGCGAEETGCRAEKNGGAEQRKKGVRSRGSVLWGHRMYVGDWGVRPAACFIRNHHSYGSL